MKLKLLEYRALDRALMTGLCAAMVSRDRTQDPDLRTFYQERVDNAEEARRVFATLPIDVEEWHSTMQAEKPAHAIAEMCSACQIEWQELNTQMPPVRAALETDFSNNSDPQEESCK